MTINGLTVRGISKYSQQLNIRIQSDKVVGNEDINVQISTFFDEVSLNWFPPHNKGLKIMDSKLIVLKNLITSESQIFLKE